MLNLLVSYGNISADNMKQLWWILIWLGGVLIGGAVGQICASSFYACGDTTTPTHLSIFTYTIYIPGKIVAFNLWGVKGLAIVTSAYYLINLFLLFYLFKKKQFL